MTSRQFARHLLLAPITRALRALGTLSLPASLADLSYDVPRRIRMPTYEGSGQATHPDVLGPDDSGRPFILAFTPYPFDIDEYENPSILVSQDGLRFREERKGLNPLAPKPEVDHNDDPDLFHRGGEYGLLYLETLRPERQNLILLRSRDRISWTRSVAASFELRGPGARKFIVSPALAERDGLLYLFYVDASASPHRIEFFTSKDLGDWEGAVPRVPVFDRIDFVPWHVDVLRHGEMYYMLVTSVAADGAGALAYDLHIARSSDLERWTLAPAPVFPKRPFGCRDVYRASALGSDGDLFVYFSYKTHLAEWGIGVARKRLSDLFPGLESEHAAGGGS
jgi:hypothetical protein